MLFLKDGVMMFIYALDTVNTCVTEMETKVESITSEYVNFLPLSDNKKETKLQKHLSHFTSFIVHISKL